MAAGADRFAGMATSSSQPGSQPGNQRGIVYLVGAGPGDPGLLTQRGAELLGRAEVLVYDGLVHPALLDLAPATCERIYAGKKHARTGAPLTQEQINALLVEHGLAGKRVVRLKGGDPFVFGRGAEECHALHQAGVRFEIVPGVTAATAVPAYAGIPLTAREHTSTVAFATGHEAEGKDLSAVDWHALARAGTVVLFMAVRTAAACAEHLIAEGLDPETPAAAIHWGTTSRQRTVVAPLHALARAIDEAALRPPALLVIGEVVALRPALTWFERRPLLGAHVLVPRPVTQAEGFARDLAEHGATPVIMPVTRIAPPTDAERAGLDRALQSPYDWAIFASANAVERFFAELRERGRDARALAGCKLACVGQATAQALAGQGLLADLVPARSDAAGLAAAVIAASSEASGKASGAAIPGTRVLVPRAAGGRDEAVEALRSAGAAVDVVTVYRTETTPAHDPGLAHGLACLRDGAIDVMAFFAPSQVQALFEIGAASGIDVAEAARRCHVIAAIGETTRAALERRGLTVHVVPERPDASLLADAIAAHYQEHARRPRD
jgi:uroporphyrinogen III methyltransferase/synthase